MALRCVLINPEKLIHPPFGLVYLGSVLKASGHEVKLVEMPFGIADDERLQLARKELESFKPDLIGITCMTMQASISKYLTRGIKEHFTKTPLLAGGVHPTIDSEDALSWGADIAVRGEAERTIIDIAAYLNKEKRIEDITGISYKINGKVTHNPDRELITNLDEIPPLSYSLLEGSRFKKRCYSIRGYWLKSGWIMTTRGCPGRCTFCASKTMHKRKVREFSIERMLDEVERLKKDYRIEGLWIFDDTFTLKEKRVLDLCQGFKKRRINIIWACQARVDTFTKGMAQAMRSSGCVQVDFGVESGSQKVLDYIKKDIRINEIKEAFRIAKESKLRTLATVMVGLPCEKNEDLNLTKDLIWEIKPSFVAPFFATPFPGTELFDIAKNEALMDFSKEINWQSTEEPLMKCGVSTREIKKAYDELLSYNKSAVFNYLLNPRFILDIFIIFLRKPSYIFMFVKLAAKGKRKDFMNKFLYVFRKEIIGD